MSGRFDCFWPFPGASGISLTPRSFGYRSNFIREKVGDGCEKIEVWERGGLVRTAPQPKSSFPLALRFRSLSEKNSPCSPCLRGASLSQQFQHGDTEITEFTRRNPIFPTDSFSEETADPP